MIETEAEKQLAKLIAMPTISDDIVANDMALDYIEDYAAKRGMFCRRDRFNGHGTLLASTRPNNLMNPTVLLSAHTDVVAADEAMFTLKKDGDKLLGRGVFDMKFSIAGYLQVIDDLQGSLQDYDFGMLISSDEEIGSIGATKLIEAGLRPKVCIMPDSTAPDWSIEVSTKGFWRFDLIAKGRSAHGARPWEGESASFKLIQALHELKTHFEGHNFHSDTLNIGKIHGGKDYNVVPSEMLASVEIRYLNRETLKKNRRMIEDLCKKHGLTLKETVLCSAVITDLEHPLVKSYMETVESVTGKRPKHHVSCAASDAPPFYDAGINCIISCCEGGGHHADDEWITRSSFLQFAPILHKFLDVTAKAPAQIIDREAALV